MTGRVSAAESFRSTTLDNGVRVLSEQMAAIRSVALGVWVRQGAAHDPLDCQGAAHLLEHMVFKGTETRSARDVATSLERVGGSLDAYTAQEHTCFLARVPERRLSLAMDVLADLVLRPLLRQADLEREKEVVAEEIATCQDTPDDLAFELHGLEFWGDHAYGRSILGTPASLEALSQDDLRRRHEGYRQGANVVVAAAGRVDHEVLLDLAARRLGDMPAGRRAPAPPVPAPARSASRWVEREGAQAHVVAAWPGPGRKAPERRAALLLSTALGGGMSSRLFQRIREELGLAYSVYSFQTAYASAGMTGAYLATRTETVGDARSALAEALRDLLPGGLPGDELQAAKEQVKGHLSLSLESPGGRQRRLADLALHDRPFRTIEELEARIDAVTDEDVLRVAQTAFRPGLETVLCLGPRPPGPAGVDSPGRAETRPSSGSASSLAAPASARGSRPPTPSRRP